MYWTQGNHLPTGCIPNEAVHCCVCTHCTERLSTVVYVQWGCPLLCMYSEAVLCCVCTVRLSTVVYSEAVHCCVQSGWPLLCTVRLSTVVYSEAVHCCVQYSKAVRFCVQYSEAVRCCAQWGCPLLCTVRLSTVVYSFETVFTVQRPGSVEEWPESYFLITVSPTNTMMGMV